MELINWILLIVYALLMSFIFCYSLIQFGLVRNYLKSKRKDQNEVFELHQFPTVTIQLPIYNERYVVTRLLDCILKFEYPEEKIEIQILDDSTDDTTEIIRNYLNRVDSGIKIVHIKRKNRKGYKAGALKNGLQRSIGEFVAIFDSDFLPEKNFLRETIPHFNNREVGMVQSRWGHLNKNYSSLTKLQAFGLDAHFTIEQVGRNFAHHFINFNGTAGVWRKQTILDAGNWQSDTLTEDLDLSYRAQLNGWQFKYLEKVVSPAELPANLSALKSQQYRWSKGAAECARKNLPKVLKSKHISSKSKVHAIFHLLNSFLFVSILVCSILSIPLLSIKLSDSEVSNYFAFGSIFIISLLILGYYYYVSFKNIQENEKNGIGSFILKFPMFLAFSMGLSLHNSIGVIEGYFGKKSSFVRTPKFNIVSKSDSWTSNQYLKNSFGFVCFMEGILAIYFSYGIYYGMVNSEFALIPFHLLLAFGFGSIFYLNLNHQLRIFKSSKQYLQDQLAFS